MNKKLTVCYFGSYDLSQSHNSTHIEGLKRAGMEVVECNLPPVNKRDDAEKYASFRRTVVFVSAFIKNSLMLFYKLCKMKDVDGVIVGYPGYFDLPLAKIYAKIKRVPLIFNVHISLYETLVLDRRYFKATSLTGKLVKWYDRLLFLLADLVLMDTQAHAEYFAELYGLSRQKFKRVFIGADPIFKPMQTEKDEKVRILFYGTFVPLHGIEYIVEAAYLLRNENDLQFEIVGGGQTKERIINLAKTLNLTNVRFVDWLDREELVQEIARADICLGGQFGLSQKADLVIGYKCFQMIAMKKAVIVSDSKGNRELLEHEVNCLMCKAGDAKSLAEAVLRLKNDRPLRERLGEESRTTFDRECSVIKIGNDLRRIVENSIHGGSYDGESSTASFSLSTRCR